MYNDILSSDLYELARELDRATSLCRRLNLCLWIFSVIQIMMPISFVIILFWDDVALTETIYIYTSSFFVFHIFFRRYKSKELKIYKRLNKLYNTLADRVDWVDLRNKALHGTLDKKIVMPMNKFAEYSLSALCIHEKGKKLYNSLNIISLLMFTITATVSAFVDVL